MEEQGRQAVRLLSLEDELAGDKDGIYREKIKGELLQLLGKVKGAMDSGLPPEEFKRISKLKASVEAGMETLQKVWEDMHA